MVSAKEQLVEQAIARRQIALIKAKQSSGANARLCIQFLAADDQDTHLGIWAQVMEGTGRQLEELIDNKTVVEVYFKTAQQGIFFDTKILTQRKKWLNRYALIGRPQENEINTVERRCDSRESVPDGLEICADVTATIPGLPEQNFSAWIWDISPTGASLVCPGGKEAIEPGETSRLAISLMTLAGRRIELSATLCNTQRLSISSSRLGVRFDEPKPAAAKGLRQLLDDLAARRIKQNLGMELRRRF
ncbi:MAG TPA: PilZ domain-containing protein [Humisphaera sp.]|jgi:c-di-GMP-binding flagellar brake protein YcgR|nr:PilZ domain-containing protein [Humisphaera sp.]